jgi:deazaflavin-dependent oxidoreductase (nitroreductase family)
MYQPVGDAFAIFATYGGSPRPPAWYRNIIKNPRVTVEVRSEVAPAMARVTHGSERERIWGEQVRLMPAFADFEAAAGRQIPILVLDRVQDTADNKRPL